jgi:hypothetical protein
LKKLGEAHPRAAQAVEWRYFGGLSMEEIARAEKKVGAVQVV